MRLLRQVGATDFVYAECTAGQEGFSFSLKLAGGAVIIPQDGQKHASTIRRIFPSDIAAALNADDERYTPVVLWQLRSTASAGRSSTGAVRGPRSAAEVVICWGTHESRQSSKKLSEEGRCATAWRVRSDLERRRIRRQK